MTWSTADFRRAARRRLPPFLFEYIDGGSFAETSLKRNIADLEALRLRQRVLTGLGAPDLSTTLFGEHLAMPLALAPVGLAGMNARRGETQAARAADRIGLPFTLSTVSVCPIAEVAAASTRAIWFQLYMIRDRVLMRDLLDEARAHGVSTLVFTVDMPVPGIRYRDYRSGLAGAPGLKGALRRFGQALLHPRWALDVGVRGRPHHLGNVAPVLAGRTGLEDFFAWMRDNFDPSIGWQDLEWLREAWPGRLFIKGVMDSEDAREARAIGADAIIVSNHGGRQLDGVSSTVQVLPVIRAAVGDAMPLLVDGGVRSGLDIFKLAALGADAALIGRAWAWALAADGETGVARLLETLATELRVAMTLAGAANIAAIDRSMLDAASAVPPEVEREAARG